MTKEEWRIVKILMTLVFLAALLPASAFVSRLFFEQDLTLEGLARLVTPAEATPASTEVPTVTVIGETEAAHGELKWSQYAVSDQSFAISIPETWQRLPMNPRDLGIVLDSVRAQNAEIANALGANAQNLMQSGIRFWAAARQRRRRGDGIFAAACGRAGPGSPARSSSAP